MNKINKTKIIKKTYEIFNREIKPQGTSSHIGLPKWAIGKKAEVRIYDELFHCNCCDDELDIEELSDEEYLCKKCLEIINKTKKDECLTCSKNLEKDNAGVICKVCSNKFKNNVQKIPTHITPYLFGSRESWKELFKINGGNSKV